jgi:hypothetical protein
MTQKQLVLEEGRVIEALKAAASKPEVREPSVNFKRDWAYGNAGLENERITRKQVNEVVK